jgi:hypothetical protein
MSIPTTYSGVKFRSRLEAKWAAFFDYAGWRWEYEPAIDSSGFWIPDFALRGKSTVLVEVKPIEWSNDPDLRERQILDHVDLEKVRRSEVSEEVLILGVSPTSDSPWGSHYPALGVFLNVGVDEEIVCVGGGTAPGLQTDTAGLYEGYEPLTFDFAALWGSFHYRMGGQGDGDMERAWREAGNLTQWRPR